MCCKYQKKNACKHQKEICCCCLERSCGSPHRAISKIENKEHLHADRLSKRGRKHFRNECPWFLKQNVFSSEKEQGVLGALVSRTTKHLMCAHPAIGRSATIIKYIYA